MVLSTAFFLAAASAGVAPAIHMAWAIPFALLLACIAIFPVAKPHFWEHHYPKVAIGLGLIPAILYFLILRQPGPWLHAMEEYLGFIILLASLYMISGGIVIRVNRKATPAANCGLLLIGAILANVFGTTGASMLLIRPFLRMNRGHVRPYHVIFFIFIVANCGGLLTPIGDPPLFLGYLQGIPFRWTLDNLWPIWLVVVGGLLAIFFVIDTRDHGRAERAHEHDAGPQVHILGIQNFIFISVVLFAVFRPGIIEAANHLAALGFSLGRAGELLLARETLMIAAALLSRRFTKAEVYRHNEFNYGPIREVAILFLGIFSTMVPALSWLETNAHKLAVNTPGQFYATTGSLSSVLDNAPTYLTFLRVEMSRIEGEEIQQVEKTIEAMRAERTLLLPATPDLTPSVRKAVQSVVEHHGDRIVDGTINRNQIRSSFLVGSSDLNLIVIAIAAGSVLFGAMTYIGNGPNFMVKSIAESSGLKMPSFGAYIFRYSLPILVPLYVLVWVIFLR